MVSPITPGAAQAHSPGDPPRNANHRSKQALEQIRQSAVLAWLQADAPQRQAAAAHQASLSTPSSASIAHSAYQGNARATAARVLSNHFPTVLAMLGNEALAVLAWRLWQRHPPVSGDLGQWGAELPALISQQPELNAWPWLVDCARLDWACHTCERSPDAQLDADSLHRLGDTPAEQLGLAFHPGLRVLSSPWPVVSLWHAHRLPEGAERDAAIAAAMEVATQADVPAGIDADLHHGAEAAVVWRQPWQAEVAQLPAAEAHWMLWWLDAGPSSTLADALAEKMDATQAHDTVVPGFEFGTWLARALTHGWLWRVSVLPGA